MSRTSRTNHVVTIWQDGDEFQAFGWVDIFEDPFDLIFPSLQNAVTWAEGDPCNVRMWERIPGHPLRGGLSTHAYWTGCRIVNEASPHRVRDPHDHRTI